MPFTSGSQITPAIKAKGTVLIDPENEVSKAVSQAMTREDAGDFIAVYRQKLKAWSAAANGSSPGQGDSLFYQLETGQDQLAAIALLFPDMSYEVDSLIKSRRVPTGV